MGSEALEGPGEVFGLSLNEITPAAFKKSLGLPAE